MATKPPTRFCDFGSDNAYSASHFVSAHQMSQSHASLLLQIFLGLFPPPLVRTNILPPTQILFPSDAALETMHEHVHERYYPTPPTPHVPLTLRLRQVHVMLKLKMYEYVHARQYPTRPHPIHLQRTPEVSSKINTCNFKSR